jgi:formate hydrogenlyase transcriptional activator
VDLRWLSRVPAVIPSASPVPAFSQGNTLVDHERSLIEAALADTKGRVSGPFGAAAKLGLPSSTLESKIKSLKIDKRHFLASGIARLRHEVFREACESVAIVPR